MKSINQTLKQYLEVYINDQKGNWKILLFLVEFVYNNLCHLSINIIFFWLITCSIYG